MTIGNYKYTTYLSSDDIAVIGEDNESLFIIPCNIALPDFAIYVIVT